LCRASIFRASSSCCPSEMIGGGEKRKESCSASCPLAHLTGVPSHAPPRRITCVRTRAIRVVVLVDEDVVQDEGEQLGLQRVLRAVDQRLQVFPASGHHLVAEDEQKVTQDDECLEEKHTKKRTNKLKLSVQKWKNKSRSGFKQRVKV